MHVTFPGFSLDLELDSYLLFEIIFSAGGGGERAKVPRLPEKVIMLFSRLVPKSFVPVSPWKLDN